MLFCTRILFLFTLGGFSGLMLRSAGVTSTKKLFRRAHFHYVLVRLRVRVMAAVYYWMRSVRAMYDMTLASGLWLSGVLSTAAVLPSHFLGSPASAAHSRLSFAVRRLEHGLLSRRLRVGRTILFVWLIGKCVRGGERATSGSGTGRTASRDRALGVLITPLKGAEIHWHAIEEHPSRDRARRRGCRVTDVLAPAAEALVP